MKRIDRIKLGFIRNWDLPGKERLSHLFGPSENLKETMRDGIIWLKNEDIAVYTSADNYIEWTILSTGTYEDEISKIIRISLGEGDRALDIGGNIGLQSIRMSQCVGLSGQVYAFEPLSHLQEKFRRNVSLNNARNITLFPIALSDTAYETEFNIDHEAWNQGTFSLNYTPGIQNERVIVKVADEITEIQNLDALAFVKIDVEGYELHVLVGLRNTLAKHRPRIVFEYDESYWQIAGSRMSDCYELLISLGYLIFQIHPAGCELIRDPTSVVGGNLFCLPI